MLLLPSSAGHLLLLSQPPPRTLLLLSGSPDTCCYCLCPVALGLYTCQYNSPVPPDIAAADWIPRTLAATVSARWHLVWTPASTTVQSPRTFAAAVWILRTLAATVSARWHLVWTPASTTVQSPRTLLLLSGSPGHCCYYLCPVVLGLNTLTPCVLLQVVQEHIV
jgi:hypothetical protein